MKIADLAASLLQWLRPTTLIRAPVSGRVVALSTINDQVFSQKLLGDGVAIEPREGKVVAPVDGEVSKVFPLGHAIGLETDDGISLLVHVGINMDEMSSSFFRTKVNKGDRVKTGDVLLEFDFEAARQQLPSLLTPVIVTNLTGRKRLVHLPAEYVTAGADSILKITGR